ncbi:PREDICTED: tumor necrosis factor receptor superfamily member 1B-like isoform X1 [Branchiostoma belcheri]|uniref:Tumor necrosis factor receptor superfamily member 1B-like isoform X1 n=1 Tax=Branchiostoma belcheri TaxID=7741 RepID=A0A6P4YQE6_BRABE|nr:PREDICTED: tumor necrosis factor receptor superfamily member 1B-like isoform X1 [Branchiostoma belcheri]
MTLPLADVPLAPPEPTSPLYSTLCTGVYPTVSVLCLRWTMTSTMEGQELSSGKGTGLTTRFASEDGKYWNMTERGCRQITKCKAGEGVSNIAVAMYDTKCTPCHPGTYSDQLSATQVCMVCTDCRALQRTTLEPCTPGQDTVCGAILIPATGPGDLQETSRPKDNSRSVPTADSQEPQNNSPVTTTEAIGGKSRRPVELIHQTQIAMIAGTTVTVVVLLMVAVAVTIFCFCKKRRRKAASSRQARPDPEGGSQLEHLMTVPNNTGQESDAGEEEEDEDEEMDPKEAVSAAGHPVQDTNDPKGNERDLSLKETNDGLEEIPTRSEGAEGTTFIKDARSPVQDTEDPEGNERDLNTKAEEDLYKETPV